MSLRYWFRRRTREGHRVPTSLNEQVLLIMTVVGVAGAIGITVLLAGIIMPSFDGLASTHEHAAKLGRHILFLAVGGSALLLLLMLVMLRRLIAHLVLAPIERLRIHMQRVREVGPLTLLDMDGRRDEIGSLAQSFNALMTQLDRQREQIEAQSFLLGRSASAVEVMHNVRNALNPIATVLSQGAAQPSFPERKALDRALAELTQVTVSSDRREKLVAFVSACFEAMEEARREQARHLGIGRQSLAHVLDIIGSQQADAHAPFALEPCDITDVIARNATIARHCGDVSIAFAFPAETHRVLANRLILSQVMGNLFANAVEAIASTGRPNGSITVTVDRRDGKVRVRIRDDGEGFAAEDASALFQRGFSTRTHKVGGLGLHWCANAMAGMRGSLTLHSEGRGRGAVAELHVLAAPSESATTLA